MLKDLPFPPECSDVSFWVRLFPVLVMMTHWTGTTARTAINQSLHSEALG